jgi:hypothetical protein
MEFEFYLSGNQALPRNHEGCGLVSIRERQRAAPPANVSHAKRPWLKPKAKPLRSNGDLGNVTD